MALPRLRVLVFPETHGTWTARGLEHDLAAEGRTVEAAVDTLLKITRAHVAYDRRHNREPLSAFAPAPERYWTAFSGATRLPAPVEIDWNDSGRRMQIVAAVASENPGIRKLSPIAQTA
jgi:hypothetical protein